MLKAPSSLSVPLPELRADLPFPCVREQKGAAGELGGGVVKGGVWGGESSL